MKKKCKKCGKVQNLPKFRHCECTQSGYVNVSVMMIKDTIRQNDKAFNDFYMAHPYWAENMLRDGKL